jgi:hypothetical protein
VEADATKRADIASVSMLVAMTAAAAWGVSYSFDASRAGEPSAAIAIAATYGVLTACAIVWAVRNERVKAWLLPASGDLARGLVCAVILFACAFGVVKLVTMNASPRAAWMARIYLQIGDTKPLREHEAIVGVFIVLMSAMEEIVWRGWAKSLLDDLVGVRIGWIAAAVLYALAHLPSLWALSDSMAGNNPMVVLGALGAGLVWSAMTRVYGRVIPSIVCHALFDWSVLVMFRLWGPSV